MRQSTIIFGSLLLAFVIYITLRGQLPAYLGLFTGKGSSANNSGSTATKDKSTTDKVTGFAKSFSTLTDTLSSMGLM